MEIYNKFDFNPLTGNLDLVRSEECLWHLEDKLASSVYIELSVQNAIGTNLHYAEYSPDCNTVTISWRCFFREEEVTPNFLTFINNGETIRIYPTESSGTVEVPIQQDSNKIVAYALINGIGTHSHIEVIGIIPIYIINSSPFLSGLDPKLILTKGNKINQLPGHVSTFSYKHFYSDTGYLGVFTPLGQYNTPTIFVNGGFVPVEKQMLFPCDWTAPDGKVKQFIEFRSCQRIDTTSTSILSLLM